MTLQSLKKVHSEFKESALLGRYITNEMITPLITAFDKKVTHSIIGYSVENRPIYSLKIGSGATKVLMWSQMHGNESTTTKVLFDLCNLFEASNTLDDVLKKCTLIIIPILNPDGAQYYTRVNANNVDLNRDAQSLSQPESKTLKEVFNSFKPDFCFNLHGQRTIYGVGDTGVSSTLSFLAPSVDVERTVNSTRKKAMSVITSIVSDLSGDLPNGIARYDDGFNINCVGDTFQNLNVPTILFEAGHYPNDYKREEVRYFMFKAIISALNKVSQGVTTEDYKAYSDIPENRKNFYDIIIRQARINENSNRISDIAIQYKEILSENTIHFMPVVEKINNLKDHYAHNEIKANNAVAFNQSGEELTTASEIDFVMLNNHKILLKP